MKIEAIETIRLAEFANLIWVRVQTDEGLIGLGETFMGPQAVEAYLHETVAPKLLGRDPLQIEALGRDLSNYLGWRSAGVETRGNSAIDIALWDIVGKHAGLPLYRLWGKAHDAIPAPLNYRGFPKSICTSVNHVVCHGIPARKPLREGDIVGLDLGCIVEGFYGDSARTVAVGQVTPEARRLMRVTEEALHAGIAQKLIVLRGDDAAGDHLAIEIAGGTGRRAASHSRRRSRRHHAAKIWRGWQRFWRRRRDRWR